MQITEFFDEMAYGELSDLSLAEGEEIKATAKPKLIIALNDALLELYTKYVLRLVDVPLVLVPTSKTYAVEAENSVRIVYAAPVLQRDYDDLYHKPNYFNIRGNQLIFTEFPTITQFGLTYQWKPSKLKVNPATPNFERQVIEADPTIMPLVRTLVAAAIFNNMGSEAHKAIGIGLLNKAQFMKAEMESSGILNTNVMFENRRFQANGFV